MNSPIIIGAGIAGLSAANYFVDHGIYPIIIEPDTIGRTKVCGEFFSYEAMPYLQQWNIPFLQIKKANFLTSSYKYSFLFPNPGLSVSRSICELKLLERATNLGVKLYKDSVNEIIPAKFNNDIHILKLSSGQILETNKLIISTGRLPFLFKQNLTTPNYIGIKSHFDNVVMPNELSMYITSGAYMGVTYINNSTVNICCLAKKSTVDKYESINDFMQYFIDSHKQLSNLLKSAKQLQTSWLTASVYKFGKKEVPNWPNSFFVGDATASIFPAAGNGLSMGLTAGIMAANHIISNLKSNFRDDWSLRYNKRLNYAKLLHLLFTSPYKANIAFKFANLFPWCSNMVYKFSRD